MKIGQLATQTGLSTSRIRYYEKHELLPPAARGDNGYRDYGPDTVKHLRTIVLSQDLGFSLAEIRRILPDDPSQDLPCVQIKENLRLKLTEVEAHMDELKALKSRLRSMLDHMDAQSKHAAE